MPIPFTSLPARLRRSRRAWSLATGVLLGSAAIFCGQTADGADGIWTGTASSNWSDPANWQNGVVPGDVTGTANTDTATFSSQTVNPGVLVDPGRNLKTLRLGAPISYTISATAGNPLVLSEGGSVETTPLVASPQTITAPLVLEGQGSTVRLNSVAGSVDGTLLVNGAISGRSASGTATQLVLTGDNVGANMLSGSLSNGSNGGVLGVTKQGSGSWTIPSANTMTGGILLEAGTLILANTTAVGSRGTLYLTGGTLRLTADVDATVNTVIAGDTVLDNRTNQMILGPIYGDGKLTVECTNRTTLTFNAGLSFSGRVVFNGGNGLLRFSGTCRGSRDATFDAGRGSATILNRNGANATYYLGALIGGPDTVLNGASVGTMASTYFIGDVPGNHVFEGRILNGAGPLGIIKSGSSRLTLSNSLSNYTLGTSILQGTLQIGGNNALPTATNPGTSFGVTLSGGILDLNGFTVGSATSPPVLMGPLRLTFDSAINLLAEDDTQSMVFQDFQRTNGQLRVVGWNGTAGGRLLFSTAASFDSSELQAVVFEGHNGGAPGSKLIPFNQNLNELVPMQSGPMVVTQMPSSVTRSSARLAAMVNPNGVAATAQLYFGTDPLTLQAIGTPANVGSGTQPQVVSQTVSGLNVETTYYFRWEASSSAGMVSGAVRSFTPANAVPVAVDDGPIALAGPGLATLAVLGNDIDPESDPLRVVSVGAAAHGVAAIAANGLGVTYDPEDSFAGTDSFAYAVSDNFGGTSASATVSVLVPDSQPPAISGTFTPLTLTTGANATATVPDYRSQAVTADNVGVTSVTQSPAVNAPVNAGVTTVTLTAFDAAGNFRSTSFDVTVQDGTPPNIGGTFTPLTVATGAAGTAAVPDYRPQAITSDNLGVTALVQTPASGAAVVVGEATVTLTARDAAQNSRSTNFLLQVTDGTPPTVAGPFTPLLLSTGANGTAALPNFVPQAQTSDNVGVTSVTQSPAAGANLPAGTLALTVTARDAAGNVQSTTFNVTVSDGTPPTIGGTFSPLELTTGSSGNVALPNYVGQAVTSDNVGVTSVGQSPPAATLVPAGTANVTLTALDAGGNRQSISFNVTVRDGTAPIVVTPPADRVLAAGPDGTLPLPDFRSEAVVTDNVGVTAITQTPVPGTVLPLGQYEVSFVAADARGNTTPFTMNVEVRFARPVVASGVAQTKTGAPAPGAGSVGGPPAGTTLGAFFTPALSDFRDVAGRVTLLAGRLRLGGIYVENGAAAAALAAFQGSPVPDASGTALPGITFKSFNDPVIAPDGSLAFAGKLQGNGVTATVDDAVWTDAFGTGLQLVLREGSTTPALDLPADARLKGITSLSLRDGELLALVTLQRGRGGVTAANDIVLLRQAAADAAAVLLRTGDGLLRSTVRSFTVLSPALGSPGHGRWHGAQSVVAKVVLSDGRIVIVRLTPNAPAALLLSTGEAAPIGPGAQWKSFGLPALGRGGAGCAVLGTLSIGAGGVTANDDTALLSSEDGSAFQVVAREGALAPLTSAAPVSTDPRFASFFDPVSNDGGRVAFMATLRGTGIKAGNKTGLWWGASDAIVSLARLGGPAPDAAGAATTAVWQAFLSLALPDGAGTGPVFLAKISGAGVTAKNQLGLWAVDSTGKLRQVLRTGSAVTIGGPLLTNLVLLNAVPGAYGAARSYNATGSLAALATFADKSQAILRLDLP